MSNVEQKSYQLQRYLEKRYVLILSLYYFKYMISLHSSRKEILHICKWKGKKITEITLQKNMLLSLGLQFKDKNFGYKNIIRDKLEVTE
jgi:hypothetical protein